MKSIRNTIPHACDPGKEHVAGGPIPGDASATNMIHWLEEVRQGVLRMQNQLQELKGKIERDLSGMSKPIYADILRKSYLEIKPTWKIAEELHYSDRNIFWLKRKALKEYQSKYAESFHSFS